MCVLSGTNSERRRINTTIMKQGKMKIRNTKTVQFSSQLLMWQLDSAMSSFKTHKNTRKQQKLN
jgi:hypothetical protein